jgi:hypothetical protein
MNMTANGDSKGTSGIQVSQNRTVVIISDTGGDQALERGLLRHSYEAFCFAVQLLLTKSAVLSSMHLKLHVVHA